MNKTQPDWIEGYTDKTIEGLFEQKNKVDTCLNWLLGLNTAVLYGVFHLKDKPTLAIPLCAVGILYTWMIMMRSGRAFRQLENFDYILKRVFELQLQSTDEQIHRTLLSRKYMDYPEGETKDRVLYRSSRIKTMWNHLKQEYGIILLIYLVVIIFETDLPSTEPLWPYLSLLALAMAWTYRFMFYKKEGGVLQDEKDITEVVKKWESSDAQAAGSHS
jgi:hypothetical protein